MLRKGLLVEPGIRGFKGKRMILDIGSGDHPHPDASHLCDLYIKSNAERVGNIIMDRPFIACSVQFLPFMENSFEFAYACQVLEHTEDPTKAVAEITRVAKQGYIETPTFLAEYIYGWSFHKWTICYRNRKLAFTKKPSTQKVLNMHKLYNNNTAFRFISDLTDLAFGTRNLRISWSKKDGVRFVRIRGWQSIRNLKPTLRTS
jgi:hypothetical protein